MLQRFREQMTDLGHDYAAMAERLEPYCIESGHRNRHPDTIRRWINGETMPQTTGRRLLRGFVIWWADRGMREQTYAARLQLGGSAEQGDGARRSVDLKDALQHRLRWGPAMTSADAEMWRMLLEHNAATGGADSA